MITNEFKKALIEGLRVVVLAVIGSVLVSLQQGKMINPSMMWLAGLIAFLKFLDKYLHESGVAIKGITRF